MNFNNLIKYIILYIHEQLINDALQSADNYIIVHNNPRNFGYTVLYLAAFIWLYVKASLYESTVLKTKLSQTCTIFLTHVCCIYEQNTWFTTTGWAWFTFLVMFLCCSFFTRSASSSIFSLNKVVPFTHPD